MSAVYTGSARTAVCSRKESSLPGTIRSWAATTGPGTISGSCVEADCCCDSTSVLVGGRDASFPLKYDEVAMPVTTEANMETTTTVRTS